MLTGKNRIDGICFFGAPKEGATAVSNTQQIADAFRDARSWRRLFLVASLFTEGLGGLRKHQKCLPLPLSLEASNQQKRTLKGMCKKNLASGTSATTTPVTEEKKKREREELSFSETTIRVGLTTAGAAESRGSIAKLKRPILPPPLTS